VFRVLRGDRLRSPSKLDLCGLRELLGNSGFAGTTFFACNTSLPEEALLETVLP
jgi:hypothetical protein